MYQKNIVAYSKDQSIRKLASSGGFCKSFLTYLIEEGVAEYVIMTRMKENSTRPESIITNDKNEILKRSNSVYEYHNQLEILKETKDNVKYAFIGLPCFVRAIRNQQKKIGKYTNIYPLISILCNQAPKPSFKKKMLEDNGIDESKVNEIDYRNGDYPGNVCVTMIDNQVINLGLFRNQWLKYNDPGYCYAPNCCLNCELFESKFADIVVGDPWLTEYEKDKDGWTKVIVHNSKSMDIVVDSRDKNYIHFEPLDRSIYAYKKSKEKKQANNKRCI